MSDLLSTGILQLYRLVEGIGAPVMVGGGVAAIFFGEPRATIDLDMVIDVDESHAQRIVDAFDPDHYYVPPVEVVRKEIRRGGRGHFNVIHPTSGVRHESGPVSGGRRPLNRYGLSRATVQHVQGVAMRFAPANYVLAMKLRYYKMSEQEKHLRDLRSMIAISPGQLDHAEIERWARIDGTLESWRSCLLAPGAESSRGLASGAQRSAAGMPRCASGDPRGIAPPVAPAEGRLSRRCRAWGGLRSSSRSPPRR